MTAATMSRVETARGASVRVVERGEGEPLVFFHGAGGPNDPDPFLDRLAEKYHVYAPEFPGYGESEGEELLEDMLDFTLHGWDVMISLGLTGLHRRPHLVGHSMGGMIVAEMASIVPRDVGKLVLIDPAGLWLDAHPIPDMFAFLPHQFAEYLFHDPVKGTALLTGGIDFSSDDALTEFFVGNARRLGTAGKILFPIPNRRLSKRLYRLTAETLIVWGESDKLIPPVYAEAWQKAIPGARLESIAQAGHMAPYEQPDSVAAAIAAFLG